MNCKMIEIIQYSDEEFESQFVPMIEEAYLEIQELLENVPSRLQVKFTDNGGSDITGVGGFAFSHNQINLAVLKSFDNRQLQKNNLRSAFFHESFHLQQAFTYSDSPFTALDAVVYEGSAMKFERDYGKNDVIYSDYSAYSEEQLKQWLEEIRAVGTEYFENEETWRKWAFYHPEYDEKWIVYKVGSFVLDNVLAESGLDILDFTNKSADEILEFARL